MTSPDTMSVEAAGKKRPQDHDDEDEETNKRLHTHEHHDTSSDSGNTDSSGNSSDTDLDEDPMDERAYELGSDEEEVKDEETGEVSVIKGGLTQKEVVKNLKADPKSAELHEMQTERWNSILNYHVVNALPFKVQDIDIEDLLPRTADSRAWYAYIEDEEGDCELEDLGNGLFREKGSTLILKKVGGTGEDGSFRLKRASK